MDRINPIWDEILEDAFETEPLAALPPGFTAAVMEKIHLEQLSRFNPFSLLDILLSIGAAITFGVMVSMPLLLPQQIQPWLQWRVQWGMYVLRQFLYSTPMLFLILLGSVVIVFLLVHLGKEMQKLNARPLIREKK